MTWPLLLCAVGFAVAPIVAVHALRWIVDRCDGIFEQWDAHSKVNPWL